MTTLSIDIETYSSVDLIKSGVYPYAEAPDFEILLFGYSVDEGNVTVIELAAGQVIPPDIFAALTDPCVLKTAYNAQFERTCISKYFDLDLPPEQWECSMARAAMCGLPLSLAAVSEALKLKESKMTEGKALINYFSKPCNPTRTNGYRTRNLPEHDPEKWRTFAAYNKRDVEVELQVRQAVLWFPVSTEERELWILDQKINDTGVKVNLQLVQNAIIFDETAKTANMDKARELTGLENPNSAAQLKKWIAEETGFIVESLSKSAVAQIIDELGGTASEMLALRQEMSKTSVKKYAAMNKAVCCDGRVRGLLQYYGANRTGRWAGRLVQVQNLPRNYLPDLSLARSLVTSERYDDLKLLYGNVPDTLSQLVRTAFIPSTGKSFIVADFSAIEARVIAWYAKETWRNEVFATHGKIYEASAAQMFRVPIESVTKGSTLRQKGKVSELALGYQGGVGALKRMGALDMGVKEDELQGLVDAWREANKNIVKFWHEVNSAAIETVKRKTKTRLRNIEFLYGKSCLFIRLPSGRMLTYFNARVERGGEYNSERILYDGMNQTTRKWKTLETYGGKLVENIVQATARDCLAAAMLRLDKAGYGIVMHCHDEVIIEGESGALEDCCSIMCETAPWAEGLMLRADGFESEFYKKE